MNRVIAGNNDEMKSGAPVSAAQADRVPAMEPDGEIAAAIGAALALYEGDNIHDRESYVITIRRKRREGDVCYLN